ncbi:hypothetical protein ADUPG1_006836 [Aduncisulcus paluster]|uniref:Exocyst complex component Sec8 n=1 Tax=Aduncisulcus paluster TaxID=2918883 RepID=A0ABQ5KLB6_9EUKA|nr:hypothetical protein ADUPG1_006836 [Aduncisulcus paluster]
MEDSILKDVSHLDDIRCQKDDNFDKLLQLVEYFEDNCSTYLSAYETYKAYGKDFKELDRKVGVLLNQINKITATVKIATDKPKRLQDQMTNRKRVIAPIAKFLDHVPPKSIIGAIQSNPPDSPEFIGIINDIAKKLKFFEGYPSGKAVDEAKARLNECKKLIASIIISTILKSSSSSVSSISSKLQSPSDYSNSVFTELIPKTTFFPPYVRFLTDIHADTQVIMLENLITPLLSYFKSKLQEFSAFIVNYLSTYLLSSPSSSIQGFPIQLLGGPDRWGITSQQIIKHGYIPDIYGKVGVIYRNSDELKHGDEKGGFFKRKRKMTTSGPPLSLLAETDMFKVVHCSQNFYERCILVGLCSMCIYNKKTALKRASSFSGGDFLRGSKHSSPIESQLSPILSASMSSPSFRSPASGDAYLPAHLLPSPRISKFLNLIIADCALSPFCSSSPNVTMHPRLENAEMFVADCAESVAITRRRTMELILSVIDSNSLLAVLPVPAGMGDHSHGMYVDIADLACVLEFCEEQGVAIPSVIKIKEHEHVSLKLNEFYESKKRWKLSKKQSPFLIPSASGSSKSSQGAARILSSRPHTLFSTSLGVLSPPMCVMAIVRGALTQLDGSRMLCGCACGREHVSLKLNEFYESKKRWKLSKKQSPFLIPSASGSSKSSQGAARILSSRPHTLFSTSLGVLSPPMCVMAIVRGALTQLDGSRMLCGCACGREVALSHYLHIELSKAIQDGTLDILEKYVRHIDINDCLLSLRVVEKKKEEEEEKRREEREREKKREEEEERRIDGEKVGRSCAYFSPSLLFLSSVTDSIYGLAQEKLSHLKKVFAKSIPPMLVKSTKRSPHKLGDLTLSPFYSSPRGMRMLANGITADVLKLASLLGCAISSSQLEIIRNPSRNGRESGENKRSSSSSTTAKKSSSDSSAIHSSDSVSDGLSDSISSSHISSSHISSSSSPTPTHTITLPLTLSIGHMIVHRIFERCNSLCLTMETWNRAKQHSKPAVYVIHENGKEGRRKDAKLVHVTLLFGMGLASSSRLTVGAAEGSINPR